MDAPDHSPNVMAWVDYPGTDWHLASSDLTALPDSSHADPTLAHSATDGATAHAATPGDHDLAMSGSGYGAAQTDATDHSSTGGGYGNAGTQATTPPSGDAHVNTPVSTTPTAPTAATPTVLLAVDHALASPAPASVVGAAVAPPLVASTASQPLVGIIDTGFAAQNAHLDYSHITLGHDYVDGDNNPLLQPGRGNDHGTGILGLVEATQNHGVEGLHEATPIWLGRATGSGHWADSLVEFVNHAKATRNDHAVVNFSFDLTQINPDGSVSTRFAFTPQELAALHYAHANHVLIVTAAGNQDGAMSALGQASQQFDNIITVGAADGMGRADYSSYGAGLDLLANGGTPEHPLLTTMGDGMGAVAGSSAAAAQVTGAVSLVWQANPDLSYRQVIDLLEHSATDVGTAGWDATTGFGVINLAAAIDLAKQTKPDVVAASAGTAMATDNLIPIPWATSDNLLTGERPTDDWSEPLPDTTSDDGAVGGTDNPVTPSEGSDTTGDDSTQTDATPTDSAEAGHDAADQSNDDSSESDMSGEDTNSEAAGDIPTDDPEGNATESEGESTGDSPDDSNEPEPDAPSASNPLSGDEPQPPQPVHDYSYYLGYSYGYSDGYFHRYGYSLYTLYGGLGLSGGAFLGSYRNGYSQGFIDGWIDAATPPPSSPPEENPDPTTGDPDDGYDYSGEGYGNEGGGYGSEPSGNGYGSSGDGYGNNDYGNNYGGSGYGYDYGGNGYGGDYGGDASDDGNGTTTFDPGYGDGSTGADDGSGDGSTLGGSGDNTDPVGMDSGDGHDIGGTPGDEGDVPIGDDTGDGHNPSSTPSGDSDAPTGTNAGDDTDPFSDDTGDNTPGEEDSPTTPPDPDNTNDPLSNSGSDGTTNGSGDASDQNKSLTPVPSVEGDGASFPDEGIPYAAANPPKPPKDPKARHCFNLIQEIINLGQELKNRFDEMRKDFHNLYILRNLISDPRLPGNPDPGSWEGHQVKYEEVQKELRAKLTEFDEDDDCDKHDPYGYGGETWAEGFRDAEEYAEKAPPPKPDPKPFTLPAWAEEAGVKLVDGVLFIPKAIGIVLLAFLMLLARTFGLGQQFI